MLRVTGISIAGLRHGTVIDEVQRAPQLFLAIKARLDRDRSHGQFLLTGSANLRQVPGVADALPGRLDYLTLWPFTQGEIHGTHEDFIGQMFAGKPPWITDARAGHNAYTPLVCVGGFPDAQERDIRGRTRYFASYIETVIQRDVAETSNVRDPAAVGEMLRLIAARSGSLARYERLARDLHISGGSAKSYLGVLERLFLVRIRGAWKKNLGQRQVKAPKLYIVDTGMQAALIGANPTRLRFDEALAGSMIETFVVTELERQASWFDEPLTFWHYREDEREVDVLVERPSGEVIGVEVKAGASIGPRSFAGLKHLREQIGDRFAAGVVLYTGERTIPFGDRLWAVPLEGLWRG